MLQGDEQRIMTGTDHEGIHVSVGRRTGPFTAEVQKNRSSAIPELIVNPVSLVVVQVILGICVEVIDFVGEIAFLKRDHTNWLQLGLSGNH